MFAITDILLQQITRASLNKMTQPRVTEIATVTYTLVILHGDTETHTRQLPMNSSHRRSQNFVDGGALFSSKKLTTFFSHRP